jgi:hypothetical protein
MRRRRPANTLTLAPPRRDAARAPHAALDIAMATVGTQHGQSRTDHPLTRHLAASTVTTQWADSLKQKTARPTVHRRPSMPVRRHLAAQRIQSVHPVPVCLDHAWPRSAHTHAQHQAPDTTTPSPCLAVHWHALATHRLVSNVTEPDRLATEPASHRHRHPYPCTQPATPSRSTALAVQSCPTEVHPRPSSCPAVISLRPL